MSTNHFFSADSTPSTGRSFRRAWGPLVSLSVLLLCTNVAAGDPPASITAQPVSSSAPSGTAPPAASTAAPPATTTAAPPATTTAAPPATTTAAPPAASTVAPAAPPPAASPAPPTVALPSPAAPLPQPYGAPFPTGAISSGRPPPPDWLYLEPFDFAEGTPIPPGYTLVEKRRMWPIVTGATVFAGGYLIAAIMGVAGMALNRENPQNWAPCFIPVVGTFIAIETTQAGSGASGSDGAAGLVSIPSILQIVGLLTLTTGYLVPEKKVLIPITPYGDVQTLSARDRTHRLTRGPSLDVGLPQFSVAPVSVGNEQAARGTVTLSGTFSLF